MGRDVVVSAAALDSMISKLEEALAGIEGAFAGVWSYLLPDTKICMGELELVREVIQALKQRATEGRRHFKIVRPRVKTASPRPRIDR